MKKASVLLALAALCFANLVFAGAVATRIIGTVTAQIGTAAPRPIRQEDELNQGDTVSTGEASAVVLKFEDGQVAALTSNSRMTITAYQYNPAAKSGNVLLSLINGGMRAITGLIGHNDPSRVSYRIATATIGGRDADVTAATYLGNVVVTVTEGEIPFTFAGRTVTVTAGQGLNARADGTLQLAAAQQILQQVPTDIAAAMGGLRGMTSAIQQASPGKAQ